MKHKVQPGLIFLLIITSVFIILFGYSRINQSSPKNVHIIYLDGKKIGLIEDDNELFKLIDEKQENIKKEFKVDKVYPPANLQSVEYATYSNNIKNAKEIYDIIESKSTFTIKGYIVTIKGNEKEPIYINLLDKDILNESLKNAINVFIPNESVNDYINESQEKIKDTGKIIENLYFDEKITIKEAYLNTQETIVLTEQDLTKYLLFGTLEPQSEYTVKLGDTIESVALANKLSPEEILVSNDNLSSINSLLSPGQVIKIGYVNPLFTLVEESEVVEDIEAAYDTIYEDDSSRYASQSYVKQEGSKGMNRITEKVLYKNGEIMTLVVSNTEELTPAIKKIVVRGTKVSRDYNVNYYPPAASNTDWGWPTISPYIITSYFGYRKLGGGKYHAGIDISGCGFGSPIYSATDGVVVSILKTCASSGYYGSSCGGGYGNSVVIETSTGLKITYAHIKNNIPVSVGQTVAKGTHIGYMGNSGSSTGTHLHFQIEDADGNKMNPCKVAFTC